MISPTRETARRGFWIASLIVPGWAQLMAGRVSAFAWLACAALAWTTVILSLFSNSVKLAPAVALATALHLLCTIRAARLAR